MTKVVLSEAAIYGIAGAIVGVLLTFLALVCLFSVYTATDNGADGSVSNDLGESYLGGLLGAWWFSGLALCCGGPLGLVLGAFVGASRALTETNRGELTGSTNA